MYSSQFYKRESSPRSRSGSIGPPLATSSISENKNLPMPGGISRNNNSLNHRAPVHHPQRAKPHENLEPSYINPAVYAKPISPVPNNQPQQPDQQKNWNEWAPSPMNEQMMNMGENMAKSFISSNVAKYQPGMSFFWLSLKYYFSVDHAYIIKKIKILLFPFFKKNWDRNLVGQSSHDKAQVYRYSKPNFDENAPDLYLPLMAFITHALISGFVKGRASNFSPEVLVEVTSSAMVIQILEVLMIRMGIYLLGSETALLDIISLTGYKFVSLCINMSIGIIFGKKFYFFALCYTAAMNSFFVFKTIGSNTKSDGSSKGVIFAGFAILQALSIWWLGDSKDL
mmetsp:Transcript_5961/g.8972  ORF Transcript_5961/g.8972 Transcript_5961/m.8972 type:complete len:340 (+) Transcript_5961:48-1067(+)|eukprot:CAMPEP_0171458388 /NCGR_PEP_ID=MMETSP0945-20130129/4088_1 /TAXON_ID=109269 /ORGANISM="Vaucheria litorea, Strain CCMP2940" /LENGTH=339 /DNA_ID=CAMNT_0011984189 /DNA_START=41 /DNA_END=1060 /DNA_ORIENTATION=+